MSTVADLTYCRSDLKPLLRMRMILRMIVRMTVRWWALIIKLA